jgi:HAD superfamily hydrolase (TIGR01450 family)
VVAKTIWNQFDVLLADLDGVIYEGTKAINGAVSSINDLQSQGIRVGYVTNNSSRKPETITEQLQGFGISSKPEDIISSGQTAVELLATKIPAGSKVLVVGGDGLRTRVTAGGFEIVDSTGLISIYTYLLNNSPSLIESGEKAKKYVLDNTGGSKHIVNYLNQTINKPI